MMETLGRKDLFWLQVFRIFNSIDYVPAFGEDEHHRSESVWLQLFTSWQSGSREREYLH
jgi:hypothetical protein